MEIASYLLAIARAFVLVLLYNLWRLRIGSHKSKGMLALEPSGALPIIGHLHKLGGQNPIARTLAAMADQYGPIFTIQFGMKSAIVISNHEAVKDCFTTNDKALATRPRSSHGKYLGYNYARFGFINYGKFWLKMRKITMLEPRFWNHNRTVRSNQENLELLSFVVFLASRTTLREKGNEPWSDRTVLRTVVGLYGSENRDQFLRFERFLSASTFLMNFGYTSMKLWSDLEEMKKKWKNTKKNKD